VEVRVLSWAPSLLSDLHATVLERLGATPVKGVPEVPRCPGSTRAMPVPGKFAWRSAAARIERFLRLSPGGEQP
jgi:hypothetical protein